MVSAPRDRTKTYADYEALPDGEKAELIDGELYLMTRPKGRHVRLASALGFLLGPSFGLSGGPSDSGPGGWWILDEPEVHLRLDRRVMVPDLAGWRRERMPTPPDDTHKFTVVPDWVCEVLSPSTMGHDMLRKMPKYLEDGVEWAWIVYPGDRRIDAFRAVDGEWERVGGFEFPGKHRLPPFEAVELDFDVLFGE